MMTSNKSLKARSNAPTIVFNPAIINQSESLEIDSSHRKNHETLRDVGQLMTASRLIVKSAWQRNKNILTFSVHSRF